MFKFEFKTWLAILLCALLAEPLHGNEKSLAERDTTNTILVLDGSGSMWGAIDGRHKILIARDVVGDVLAKLPDSTRIGLLAYGHNRKGDCEDIELLAEVGASKQELRAAAQRVTPLGKTPLSAAVQKAATLLNNQSQPATVVLVSDGEETCDLDPCAVGAQLEADGVDFTAHVVGFGLVTDEQHRGLRCLAENTGGRYFAAGDADELAQALQRAIDPASAAVETPKSANAAASLLLRATDLEDGPIVEEGLHWQVIAAADKTNQYQSIAVEGVVELGALLQGRYQVSAVRRSDGATAQASVFVESGQSKTVTLALEIALSASVRTEPEHVAPAGSTVDVYWTGPNRKHDWIGISSPDARADSYLRYRYTRHGNPVSLQLPNEPGNWEVRYVVGQPVRVLARHTLTTTATTATVSSAPTVIAGAELEVHWTGPDYRNDWIGLARLGVPNQDRFSYEYTKRGSPLSIEAPMEPGDYEIRYINSQGSKTLASQPIKVVPVTATLSLPATTIAGGGFEVTWSGPDYKGDWVGTAHSGAAPTAHSSYAYTKKGVPLRVPAPAEPGRYLVRYVSNSTVLSEASIEVKPVHAHLTAPSKGDAGAMIEVEWQGPNYKSDYVTISYPKAKAQDYLTYSYTRKGSPVSLQLPEEPGIYELRYVMTAGRKVLFTSTIEVQ